MRGLHIIVTGESGSKRSWLLSPSMQRGLGGALAALALLFMVLALHWSLTLSAPKRARVARLSQEVEQLRGQLLAQATRIDSLERSNRELLTGALAEIGARGDDIEAILKSVGMQSPVELTEQSHSGGPFRAPPGRELESALLRAEALLKQASRVPLGRPVEGRVSSRYGRRRDPFTGLPALHDGLDFKAARNAPIRATADGIVRAVGYQPRGYGRFVRIEHAGAYTTLFAHLIQAKTKVGDRVQRGDLIGLMGNTGRSTGTHLHYEIRREGKTIDPAGHVWARIRR